MPGVKIPLSKPHVTMNDNTDPGAGTSGSERPRLTAVQDAEEVGRVTAVTMRAAADRGR